MLKLTTGKNIATANSTEVTESSASLLSKDMGTQIVQILVGKSVWHAANAPGNSSQLFSVHKDLLAKKSRVFGGMFDGHFMEGKSGVATLPEENPDTFHLFIGWIYTDTLEEIGAVNLDPYIDMISFGEKYCVAGFADLALEAMIAKMKSKNWVADLQDIERAYAVTSQGSKLRLYMARSYAYMFFEFKDEDVWSTENMMPVGPDAREILMDFHRIARDLKKKKLVNGKVFLKNPNISPKCEYHSHPQDVLCPYISRKRKLDH